MALATILDKVKSFMSGRDALVKELEALKAEHAAEAEAEHAEIAKAQAEVDELDEPVLPPIDACGLTALACC